MSIIFDRVAKVYPGEQVAVSDFSLEVPSGATTVLLGSSGCGKTTLMRMVNRMVDPTSGRVLIDGADLAGSDPVKLRRSIGYVMQNGGLLPHWSVLDNIATVLRLNGESKSSCRERAVELLRTVGLEESLASRYPDALSGGQRQRVGVARALAADPEVLLMDEPFAAVDPIQRRVLQDELLRIQEQLGKTIIFVTHDVDEALRLGDVVAVLRGHGELVQVGTAAELVARPVDDFVSGFLGLGRAERHLRIELIDGREVAVDGAGRPVGIVDR